jgi:hypothetical protein
MRVTEPSGLLAEQPSDFNSAFDDVGGERETFNITPRKPLRRRPPCPPQSLRGVARLATCPSLQYSPITKTSQFWQLHAQRSVERDLGLPRSSPLPPDTVSISRNRPIIETECIPPRPLSMDSRFFRRMSGPEYRRQKPDLVRLDESPSLPLEWVPSCSRPLLRVRPHFIVPHRRVHGHDPTHRIRPIVLRSPLNHRR